MSRTTRGANTLLKEMNRTKLVSELILLDQNAVRRVWRERCRCGDARGTRSKRSVWTQRWTEQGARALHRTLVYAPA